MNTPVSQVAETRSAAVVSSRAVIVLRQARTDGVQA